MGVTAEEKAQVVEKAIQGVSHIATLPEITLRIIELVEDPSSTVQDLHQVIAHDPALCSRILKVVNSAFYGLPGQIGSINRAVVLLGLNAVKNIAIAASLAKLFRGGQLCPAFSAKDLWKHSVATAAGAKSLADVMKLGLPDEAFLGGLIHDLGVMLEMQFDREKLIEVFDKLDIDPNGAPANNMIEIEDQVFGANHQDFGRAICAKWKFPKPLHNVTGAHHDPLSLPEGGRTLACVVHIADILAAKNTEGFRLDISNLTIDPSVLDELKLTQAQIDSIEQSLPEALDAVETMLAG